jgi:hypothetical protein
MPTVKTLSTFILLATGRLYAQFAYPNCAAISDKDFSATTLVSKTNDVGLFEPLKMDFSMSDQGVVDIFFIERGGSLKMYSGTAKTVRTLGNVAPDCTSTTPTRPDSGSHASISIRRHRICFRPAKRSC